MLPTGENCTSKLITSIHEEKEKYKIKECK